jgi:hypothetical protein
MTAFWFVVAVCLWISYVSARDRGVPWFSLGGTRKRRPAPAHMEFRLRTENIKPRSAWLEPKQNKELPTALVLRLDELTHNADTSQRLIAHMRQLHPDRSLKWCAEKAIYDIERDRMAR